MCITFLMLNPDAAADQWQLVLINNRDEHYDRPTSKAAWKDGLLAGRDMMSNGGTWMGITETGRIAVLMNVTEPPENIPPNPLSRGYLVSDFLGNPKDTPSDYAERVGRSDRHAGFSMLLLEKDRTQAHNWRGAYCSNRFETPVEALQPGVHGFSNCPRARPYLKVQRGVQRFQQVLFKHLLTTDTDKWQFVDDLVNNVLTDKTLCLPDPQLRSQTAHSAPEVKDKLSAIFVEFPIERKYGTRTHTVILIDGDNNVTHVERTMNEKDYKAPWIETKHEFRLKE